VRQQIWNTGCLATQNTQEEEEDEEEENENATQPQKPDFEVSVLHYFSMN